MERDGTRGTNPRYQARWVDYLLLSAGQDKAQIVFCGDSDFVRESGKMELQGFDCFRLSNLF